MSVLKFTIEVDIGDSDRELPTLEWLSNALWLAFGEDYRLFTVDGKRVKRLDEEEAT